MANLLFYLMAAGTVVAAVGVVVARNPVKSVLALLISFVCLSVIYLLAGFQFLAAIQILLYGGAVMVLFLFVVMLLNLGDPDPADDAAGEPLFHGGRRALLGIGIAAAICIVGLTTLLRASLAGQPAALHSARIVVPEGGFDPVMGLAEMMFTRYALPFEAASVLLLASAVGVLVIAKRQRRETGAAPIRGSGAGHSAADALPAAGSARPRLAEREGDAT